MRVSIKNKKSFQKSLENTVATMQKVLLRTMEHAKAVKGGDLGNPRPEDVEMKLVQSLDDIRNPNVLISATQFSD